MTETRGRIAAARSESASADGDAPATGVADALAVAFAELPVGVLVATPAGDRANAELRRIWRAAPDAQLDRRIVDERVRPFHRRAADRPTDDHATAREIGPIRAALAGRSTDAIRLFVDRLDGTRGVVRVSARPLALPGDEVGAVLTAADEFSAFETERLRDSFLGIVGHELRTPISSILTAADLLALPDLGTEVRAEVLAGLSEETRRLHLLIEQLLRLADLERRGVDAADEPVHLGRVAQRVIRRRHRHRRDGPRLEVPSGPLPPVAADDGFVDQVIVALLDNAEKHAAGADVTVRLEVADDAVELHVLDAGAGLPKGGAEPIFALFHRATPAGSPQPPGVGIGLFVARSIIEAMGGRIWATDRPGGGADVGFALPIVTD